jgi:hypothetical protein
MGFGPSPSVSASYFSETAALLYQKLVPEAEKRSASNEGPGQAGLLPFELLGDDYLKSRGAD